MASLKQLRERARLTQIQIANKLNITLPALPTYKSGKVAPPLEDMIILERTFHATDRQAYRAIKPLLRANLSNWFRS